MGWKFWRREANPMDPKRPVNDLTAGPFIMPIADVFWSKKRGTVVSGSS